MRWPRGITQILLTTGVVGGRIPLRQIARCLQKRGKRDSSRCRWLTRYWVPKIDAVSTTGTRDAHTMRISSKRTHRVKRKITGRRGEASRVELNTEQSSLGTNGTSWPPASWCSGDVSLCYLRISMNHGILGNSKGFESSHTKRISNKIQCTQSEFKLIRGF